MRKKLFTLMTLLLTAVTGAWAQTTLFSTDFSDDAWSGITNICNSKNASDEVHNGITFHSYNSSAKPFVVDQASGEMTWCGNNMGNNFWIAIPVSGVKGQLTIMVDNGSTATRFKYAIKAETTISGSPGSGTDSGSASDPATVTISDLDETDYVVYLGRQGSSYTTITSITITTPTAPAAPSFSPNGGGINGNETVTLTGTATTFYYQWSTDAAAGLTTSSGGWSTGATATVPNETGTQYLYAYASNGAGLNSAVVRSDAFTITKDTYEFNAPVKYALAEGDAFTSGQTVSVKDGTKEVATITYGEAGGADFPAAVAEGTIDGYSAMTAGNGTNGDKTGGTWYTIIPKFDCVISVGVALNKDKLFYIKEDGTSLTAYDGITVGAKYTGTYEFKATANSEYKIYCAGSKLGFYGFTMSPYVTATIGSTGWATFASDKILDFKKTTPALTATYIVTGGAEGKIQVESVDEPIAAGQGVLLKGDAATYYISVGASATFDDSENKLVGVPTGSVTVTSSSNSGFNYVMAKSGDKAVFKRIGSNSATITAGKAYLALTADPGTAASSELSLEIVDNSSEDITTGISAIEHSTLNIEHSEVYNLNGQRVANPTKGLYIVNGKKVIVK